MRIIVAASIKGGVGKTSTAVFLAQALVAQGRSVLAIDCDHNNNLTDFFLRDVDPQTLQARNVYNVLSGQMNPTEAVFPLASGPAVLPATPTLVRAAAELGQDPGALLRFPAALRWRPRFADRGYEAKRTRTTCCAARSQKPSRGF